MGATLPKSTEFQRRHERHVQRIKMDCLQAATQFVSTQIAAGQQPGGTVITLAALYEEHVFDGTGEDIAERIEKAVEPYKAEFENQRNDCNALRAEIRRLIKEKAALKEQVVALSTKRSVDENNLIEQSHVLRREFEELRCEIRKLVE